MNYPLNCAALALLLASGPPSAPAQVDEKDLDALIRSLDSDTIQERERAETCLIQAGEKALVRLKAALPRATSEQKGRLSAIIQEIELRAEEVAAQNEGLPPRLVRLIPAFRQRMSSSDEHIVLDVVREIFGYRKEADKEEDRWNSGNPKIESSEEAREVLKAVLARCQGSALKLAVIRNLERWQPGDVGQGLSKLVGDADPAVRKAVLAVGMYIPLVGAEEELGRLLKEGSNETKGAALRAFRQLGSSRAKELSVLALSDESPEIRSGAIQLFLWGEAPSSAISGLRRLLKDSKPEIRSAAVYALTNHQAFDAAGDILALKDDPSPIVRRNVLNTFGVWRDARGKDAVLEALEKPQDPEVTHQALLVAAEIGGPESLAKLFEILKANQGGTSDLAAGAMSAIGPGDYEKPLLQMASEGESALRRRAILALSGQPSGETVRLFLKALSDPDAGVQKAAAAGLGRARGPDSMHAKQEALKDPSLRMVVLGTLAHSEDATMAPLVAQVLTDSDSAVVLKALEVIESKVLRDTAPEVEKLLAHPSDKVREKAVEALERIAGTPAIRRHLDLLDSENAAIRRRAINFLELDPDEIVVDAVVSRFEKLRDREGDFVLQILERVVADNSTAFLRTLTEKERGKLRWKAALALARRRDERGLTLAREYLHGQEMQVRLEAARVLIHIPADGEESAKALIAGIPSANEYEMRWYLAPVARRHRPEVKKILVDRLNQEEWYERDHAATWMGGYPPGTFVDDVRRLSREGSEAARRGAARALFYVEVPDRAEILTRLLRDDALTVREEALGACQKAPLDHAPEGLASFLSDSSEKTRVWAIEALTSLDPAPLKDHLGALLSDPSQSVRAQALRAVAVRKIPLESATLLKFLDDPNYSVRQAAIDAARALGDKACVERLLKISKEDSNDYTSSHAAQALLSLGQDEGRDAVRARLGHGAPIFEAAAALQLMRGRDLPSVPAALRFVAASGSYLQEANRVLLAMNAWTQPDLYERARAKRIKVGWTRGTRREWLSTLSTAYGIRFDIERGFSSPFLDQPMPEEDPYERSLDEEMAFLGYDLGAACVFEPDRVRVLRRADAIAYWERWYHEAKK